MAQPAATAQRAVHSLKELSGSLHARNTSPTATLLRNSRVFSLPQPLPRPDISLEVRGLGLRNSDTATLPYPTHQAITTPPSSLARGDWGLKRPLPLRSTTSTSTPHFRVKAIDTFEHVTEFESAADHTRTLEKWQELELAVTTIADRRLASGGEKGKSVFESNYDNTDKETAKAQNASRWRHEGPYLPNLTEAQFNRFLERRASKDAKAEFRDFIRADYKRSVIEASISQADSEGGISESASDRRAQLEQTVQITDEDVDRRIKELRAGKPDAYALQQLVEAFLDLPPTPFTRDEAQGARNQLNQAVDNYMPRAQGPPSTHPSAGLSYLRTDAFLHNHPMLGPQAHKRPVEARVIQPKETFFGTRDSYKAKLGVAGVVADDSYGGQEPGVRTLDYTTEGGKKVWVHPTSASIYSDGRIKMEVQRSTEDRIAIHRGQVPEPRLESPSEERVRTGRSAPTSFSAPFDRGGRQRPRIEGFSGEEVRRAVQGNPAGRRMDRADRKSRHANDLFDQINELARPRK